MLVSLFVSWLIVVIPLVILRIVVHHAGARLWRLLRAWLRLHSASWRMTAFRLSEQRFFQREAVAVAAADAERELVRLIQRGARVAGADLQSGSSIQ